MPHLLDTNVLILLRDGDESIAAKVGALGDQVLMSVVSRVELEGGVYQEESQAPIRRRLLNEIIAAIPTLAFDSAAADIYGAIVAATGYSRRKVLDRMIAAQALCQRASLVTLNARDYSDIAGLSIVRWKISRAS